MAARPLLVISGVLLFHVAFSTYEHLSQLKALERPQDRPLPHDIVLEAIIALGLGILAAVLNTPPLKEITWSSEMKQRTLDEMDSRLSFMNVNNRAKKLFGDDSSFVEGLKE